MATLTLALNSCCKAALYVEKLGCGGKPGGAAQLGGRLWAPHSGEQENVSQCPRDTSKHTFVLHSLFCFSFYSFLFSSLSSNVFVSPCPVSWKHVLHIGPALSHAALSPLSDVFPVLPAWTALGQFKQISNEGKSLIWSYLQPITPFTCESS